MKLTKMLALLGLMLAVALPSAGHADDWRGGHDGRDRGFDRHDGRGYGHGWNQPVYFNNYRPRVVTRYVPYAPPPVVYYQRPPVVYYRDVVYYDNGPVYRVGDRLGAFHSVPQSVLVQLDPPPRGYYYAMGGSRDVLLVSHQTNAIAQIISLFLQ